MEIYEKVSDEKFTSTETKEEVKTFSIADLNNDRAIYIAEIAVYQAKVDAVDALLAEAEKLGIVEKAELAVV